MKKIRVTSADIAALTRDEFRTQVVGSLRGTRATAIAKVNSEFLLRALDDPEFRDFLSTTGFNIADGAGVLWAARFLTLKNTRIPALRQLQILWQAAYSLGSLTLFPRFCSTPIPERIPGVDALFIMLQAAQEADVSVYFLGAGQDINSRARLQIQARMPKLKIAGGRDGYTEDWDSVLREIDDSGAALLVVALGSPKQEYWIRDHLHQLRGVKVAVGEGGSLDFIAGDFRRAPDWLQRVGLEWFWRLFMNRNKTGSVSRARRIWNAVPVFISRTIRWKLTYGPVSAEGTDSA
jgi:N-acetylglucosaminyldiphosphoundecaprenol N-acetyl-beta-D-mannosaminyltransferase